MVEGIIGRKIGMTRVFSEKGEVAAVTAIEAGPCAVTQVKTDTKEGYNAIQLGFGEDKRIKKPEKGHVKELGNFEYLREFRVDKTGDVKVGDKLDVSMFKAGDIINVIGISKKKGFAGVVERYHFKGGPKTHGQSDRTRAPGAIGSTTQPGRVLKGLRMAGRMGGERVTALSLKVFKADPEKNLLLVEGAVPGYRNELLLIEKTSKRK